MSSSLRTVTLARYSSMRAFPTLFSLRLVFPIMTVSKVIPFIFGTLNVTFIGTVVKFRL